MTMQAPINHFRFFMKALPIEPMSRKPPLRLSIIYSTSLRILVRPGNEPHRTVSMPRDSKQNQQFVVSGVDLVGACDAGLIDIQKRRTPVDVAQFGRNVYRTGDKFHAAANHCAMTHRV